MASKKPSNHTKPNKKFKNQTLEAKFRFELDRCSKNKDLATAISLYDSAVSHNIRLNHHHFNALLYLCSASLAAPSSAETVDSETPDSSKLLAVERGFRIYDHMISCGITPNEATITAMARVAAAKGDGDFAFDLVKTMKKYNASPRLRTYDSALFCFCGNSEADKAYEVEEHMGMMGVAPEEPELAALLDVSARRGREGKVYEYLHRLRSSVGCLSESSAGIIESWFQGDVARKVEGVNVGGARIKEAFSRNGGGWHGLGWMGKGKWIVQRSNVDVSGSCCGCNEQLVCTDIDREETEKFAQSVASLAMEREVKTNFCEFQAWLDEHVDYEVIVDGANIGLYQQNFAEGGFSVSQLDAVVKEMHSRSQNKWPLVILHNKRLRELADQKLLEEWKGRGVLYATPNGSNDDWYWLYAAVKLKCLLVTNDEMRDHIFELLGRSFFMKWKERHQVRYTFMKGNLKLQMPPSYSLVIQESEKGSWHVPVAGESCEEASRTWLCITRSSLEGMISSTASNGMADSFKVSKEENKVEAINGKRKDRSPSSSPAHHSSSLDHQ